MSHEIDMSNGRANIAFIGAEPWHGLGSRLTPDASIEEWVREAGLGFGVAKAPIFAQLPVGTLGLPSIAGGADVPVGGPVLVKNKAALYREDTGAVLGVVSQSHHKVVQPREVVEFHRDLVAELGLKLEVAGSIKGGQRVWALARNGREMRIHGNDVVRPYLLCATAYDGLRSTEVMFTTVRVVCNNTLTMAYTEGEATVGEGEVVDEVGRKRKAINRVAVPHSQEVNWDAVKAQLSLWTLAAEQFEEQANRLAARAVTEGEAMAFLSRLFAAYKDDGKTLTAQSKAVLEAVVGAYRRGPGAGLKSAEGTAWGLVNAVTYYVDHGAKSRSQDNRLNSAWFGAGAEKKAQAVKLANEMLLAA